jgi:uncharacterized protein with FMN-binding domain
MRKFAVACVGLGLILALSGCSKALVGTWRTENVDPPEASKHFQLAKVTFNDDGTYQASATYGGKSHQDSGEFKFDGFKLSLETKDRGTRTYGATYNAFTNKLTMTSKHEGQKITAILMKEEPEED